MREIFVGAMLLALVGCSEPAPAPTAPDVRAGSELELESLAGADTSGRLSGELGCSFAVGDDVLLIAMGVVASQTPSEALVKRDGALVELQAAEPGGFDTLDDGETFAGGGLTVDVATTAEIATGTEEVQRNATLTAHADGDERAYEGVWTCGP